MPDLGQFSISRTYHYDIKDVRKYENHCIKLLDYKLDIFTADDILNFFINTGLFFNDEIHADFPVEKVFQYAYKLLSSFIFNNLSLNFSAMQIALSILCITREHFKFNEERSEFLLHFYGFSKDHFILDCIDTVKSEECSKLNTGNLITPFVREKEKSHTTKVMINVMAVQEKLRIKAEDKEKEKEIELENSISKNIIPIISFVSSNHSSSKNILQIPPLNSNSNSKDKKLNFLSSSKFKYTRAQPKGNLLTANSNHSNASTSSNASSRSMSKCSNPNSNRSKNHSQSNNKPEISDNCLAASLNINKSTNFNKLTSLYKLKSKFRRSSVDFKNNINKENV